MNSTCWSRTLLGHKQPRVWREPYKCLFSTLTHSRERHGGFPSVSVESNKPLETLEWNKVKHILSSRLIRCWQTSLFDPISCRQVHETVLKTADLMFSDCRQSCVSLLWPGVPDVDVSVHRTGDQELRIKPGPVQITGDTNTAQWVQTAPACGLVCALLFAVTWWHECVPAVRRGPPHSLPSTSTDPLAGWPENTRAWGSSEQTPTTSEETAASHMKTDSSQK